MTGQAARRGLRIAAGALVALAAVACVAPPKAQAGCTHAAPRTDPLAEVARLELLDGAAEGLSDATPADFPKPCSGPSCSGRSPLPLPPPAAASPAPAPQWGCLTDAPALRGPEGRAYDPSQDVARPLGHGLAIDRPPRPASPFLL